MTYTVITPTAQQDEPVSRADARMHLRQQGLTLPDDADLDLKRAAAREFCEQYCGQAWAPQTIEFALDAFPEDAIELPLSPATTIVSVTYQATGGPIILPTNQYVVDRYSMPNWLVPVGYWPTPLDVVNSLVIRYSLVPANVPALVRSAILLMIGHLYNNREATTDQTVIELPLGVTKLLNFYRVDMGV